MMAMAFAFRAACPILARSTLAGALVAAGLWGASPVQAEETAQPTELPVVSRFSTQLVGQALSRYGLEFEQQRDRSNDPLLIIRPGPLVHDQGMAVIFYGCDDADTCETASLYTFFRTDRSLDSQVFHVWNDIFRVRTWTKAFQDSDGDTALVMNLNAVGGIGVPALDFMIGVFLTEVKAFKDALQGGPDGSAGGNLSTASRSEPEDWASVFNETFGAMTALQDPNGEALKPVLKTAPKAVLAGEPEDGSGN